jgi:hypothetical protein
MLSSLSLNLGHPQPHNHMESSVLRRLLNYHCSKGNISLNILNVNAQSTKLRSSLNSQSCLHHIESADNRQDPSAARRTSINPL